jgi:putative endonuclease
MAEHNDLGELGEIEAQNYLRKNGYTIRHTNWTAGSLEIDIVAEKDEWLVIVEVKTRKSNYIEQPKDAINMRKIRNLVNAADAYIRRFNWEGETRFDVISVVQNDQKFEIEHIEDAFLPPMN